MAISGSVLKSVQPPCNMSDINALTDLMASTGGVLLIGAGTVTLDENGILRSGVSIQPTPPKVEFNKNCPDLGFFVTGGTLFQGTGTETVWEANKVVGGSCTADNATDTFTKSSHGIADGTPVWFTASVIPAGLTAESVTYYVINATTNTFQISATEGGSAVNFTTNGTSVVVHIGGAIGGIEMGGFAAKNVKHVYDVGGAYAAGMAFSKINQFVVETCEDWVMNMAQCQHLLVEKPHGFDVKRGVRFYVEETACSPGLSEVIQGFMYLRYLTGSNADYQKRWGYVQEAVIAGGYQIDQVFFNRCQVNSYGGGTTSGTITAVDTGTETLTLSTAHGRSIGEPIFFSDASASLPGGLTADESYVIASVPSSTQVTLNDRDGNPVNLTSTTTGGNWYVYPGDTRSFVSKGADSVGTSNGMKAVCVIPDGCANTFFSLKNAVRPDIEVTHIGSTTHGPAEVIAGSVTNLLMRSNHQDTRVKIDTNSPRPWIDGTIKSYIGVPPLSPYLDYTTGRLLIPVAGGSTPKKVQCNPSKYAFEPYRESNDTWPHFGVVPFRSIAISSNTTAGKDRVGGWRFTNGSLITFTLPAIATVADGAMFVLASEGAGNVTIDPNASETINGSATKTLTAGNVAIVMADNANSNWVAFYAPRM